MQWGKKTKNFCFHSYRKSLHLLLEWTLLRCSSCKGNRQKKTVINNQAIKWSFSASFWLNEQILIVHIAVHCICFLFRINLIWTWIVYIAVHSICFLVRINLIWTSLQNTNYKSWSPFVTMKWKYSSAFPFLVIVKANT